MSGKEKESYLQPPDIRFFDDGSGSPLSPGGQLKYEEVPLWMAVSQILAATVDDFSYKPEDNTMGDHLNQKLEEVRKSNPQLGNFLDIIFNQGSLDLKRQLLPKSCGDEWTEQLLTAITLALANHYRTNGRLTIYNQRQEGSPNLSREEVDGLVLEWFKDARNHLDRSRRGPHIYDEQYNLPDSHLGLPASAEILSWALITNHRFQIEEK